MPLKKYACPQQISHDVPHYLLYFCPPYASRFIATPSRSKIKRPKQKPPTCSEGTRTRTAISSRSPHVTIEQLGGCETRPTIPVQYSTHRRKESSSDEKKFSLFVQSFRLISLGLLPPSFQSNTRGGRTVS
ncbi:unnamed protein product [Ectocarpus sp. 12 AP-2014]